MDSSGADYQYRVSLNPIDFGATGDGITDDCAVFQCLLEGAGTGRGCKLELPPMKFRWGKALRIQTKSISIDGGANGFSNSPNAEHESQTGSEIFADEDALQVGNHDPRNIAGGYNKLGAINLSNLYLWGSGVYSGRKAIFFDQQVDQNQLHNIHIGNFQWGVFSDTVLDDPTLESLDIIHCFEGIHFSAKSLAAYVKIHHCTIADNDGTGIFIHPDSNSFGCQLSHSVLVRNARTEVENGCNVYWGAREGIITDNIIHAGGYHFYNEAVLGLEGNHVSADGIVVDGSDNIISGNQILEHITGTGVVIQGNRNQVIHNSFNGRDGSSRGAGDRASAVSKNLLDIKVERGSCDTVIVQPGKVAIQDEGIRTIINGVTKNDGDPDLAGDWSGVEKMDGLIVYDTVGHVAWLYGKAFPGGRIKTSNLA